MTEEQVTKNILKWLEDNKWEIVCFDFPQSGTGKMLHPNDSNGEKNKYAIIPDIVAVKNGKCLFFENKDRFYYPDYKEINNLIVANNYTIAIENLLKNYSVSEYYYGIGIPTLKHSQKAIAAESLVNFVIGVEENDHIKVLYIEDGLNIG